MIGRLIAIITFACATGAVRAEDIAATIEPEKPTIILGEPIFLTFTPHNQTDHDIYFEEGGDYRNRLGRPEKYAVTARDEKNERLPIIDVGPTMGGLETLDRIPAHGTWHRQLFLPSWVRFTSVGRYRIECGNDLKTATKGFPDGFGESLKAKPLPVQATTTLTVQPADEHAMKALIQNYAQEMLSHDERKAQPAIARLTVIDDPAVIPFLVMAVKTGDSGLYGRALTRLGQFDDDRAVDGIVQALTMSVSARQLPRAHSQAARTPKHSMRS